MEEQFYDKVAKKFGGYYTNARYFKDFLDGDPESDFKAKLIAASGKEKIALDIGCADGRFTLKMASNFKKIIAIDISGEMLKAAQGFQKEIGVKNVSFEVQDVEKMHFAGDFFDVAYNRRGPAEYKEFYKVLKPGGAYLEIDVAEKDTRELKEIFGRGQAFGRWDEETIERNQKELREAGFQVTFAKEYFYNEYYKSYEDLNVFLQCVPIFEDFDPEKDKKNLEKYVSEFTTEKGIKLSRHRVVIEALKK